MVKQEEYKIWVEVFTYGEYDYILLSDVTMLVTKKVHAGFSEWAEKATRGTGMKVTITCSCGLEDCEGIEYF